MLQQEKKMIYCSLVCSLIGIGILLIMQKSGTSPTVKISEINDKLLNTDIVIKGTLTSLRETPSVTIAQVKDKSGTIDVVAFKSDTLEIKKGQTIEIEGKIKKYKENLQVEAKRIRKLS